MAKKFENPTLNGKTKTNAIHPVAFINQPVAAPHQSFLPIGSEVPLVKKSSFPPGEAKGRLRELTPFNIPICSRRGRTAKSPYHLQIGYSCNRRGNKTGSIDKTIKMFYSILSEFV